MKKILAMALLTLGGCAAFKEAGDSIQNPPLDVVESIRKVFEWLSSLVAPFLKHLLNLAMTALGLG